MAKRINLLEGNIALSLTKLSLPLMGMSFLQMAYNLTDVFWIGKLGAGPVASVGTGGLLIWLSFGIHTISQLGGQVYVGQNLGAKDNQAAGKFAHASIFLSTCISIILGLFFVFFVDQIIAFLNLNDPQVIKDAKSYIMLTCGFIFFQLLTKLLTALITTTGDSKTPFVATTIGLIFNIVFDPILIFGFGPIPALGVLGAAIATVLAQMIVFTVLVIHAVRDTHLFCHINLKKLPELWICKKIMKLGLPTTFQASLFPLLSMYVARLVADFGDGAIAVQRIGSQIESLSWMTTEGFAVAVNSFMAQNFGAKNIKRAKQGYKQSMLILSIYAFFVTLLLIFGAKPIFSIFIKDVDVIKMGVDYLMILGTCQLFLCWEILSINAMNALEKTLAPSIISIIFTSLRIPIALVLITTSLGLCGIWWAISISTITKGIMLFACVLIYFKKPIFKDN